MTDQPMPTAGGVPVEPIVRQQFNDALTERTAQGVRTYGMPLATHNGRDAGQDAFEELIDLAQYLTQLRIEHADALTEIERLTALTDPVAEGAILSRAEAYRLVEEARQMRAERDAALVEIGDLSIRLETETARRQAAEEARDRHLMTLCTRQEEAILFKRQATVARLAVALLNSMVLSGEDHSDQSRQAVREALE